MFNISQILRVLTFNIRYLYSPVVGHVDLFHQNNTQVFLISHNNALFTWLIIKYVRLKNNLNMIHSTSIIREHNILNSYS